MKTQNTADSRGGFPYAENQGDGISAVRQQVISGNWTAINNGDFTLTDLGLRHNGSGLVWLRSGVSVWEAESDAGFSGKDRNVGRVNGLPIELVHQWSEYWTKRSFAVSVSTELRRRYYRDDAEFGKAMREAGYVPVRSWKLTGKKESFWLYRKAGDDKGVCPAEQHKNNKLNVTVQASEKPQKAFKLVAVDGRWLYVYDDHIRYLRKIRTRIDGKQVQGYTAKGVRLEVVG